MKIKKIISGILCGGLIFATLIGCGEETDKEYKFKNAGFEIGTLTG